MISWVKSDDATFLQRINSLYLIYDKSTRIQVVYKDLLS